MKVEVCPHCGHPLAPPGVKGELQGRQRAFFEIVESAGTYGIDGGRLRIKLYADDRNGGPESPNIIAVMAQQINRKLKPWGLSIRAKGGKGEPYKLRLLR
jgi:hypothetical protein